MARHDRSYGVWFQSGRKGGSRRRKAGTRLVSPSGRRGSRKSTYAIKKERS